MRIITLRTAEQKADLALAWSRPDEEFFASGACHVLAAAFLLTYPAAGFRPWRLAPTTGQRGGHLFVMRDDRVFESAGYAARNKFLLDYFDAMRRLLPDWDARLVEVGSDPIGWDFCAEHRHRHPSQFLHDPMPRALAFVDRFRPHA